MFAAMLTLGGFFDISTKLDVDYTFCDPMIIRLLFAVYAILSTVVLMNILIAMMNHTYSEVMNLKDILWAVEGLRFVSWISYDNSFCLRSICKAISKKYIFSNVTDDRHVWIDIPHTNSDAPDTNIEIR